MSSTAVRLEAVESLQRYVEEPILSPRLTVRREGGRYVGDAALRLRGRVLADGSRRAPLRVVDAADGRGKALYLRHEGDYGLVETV